MATRGRIVLGLNSGTSADGVDAGACEITGCGLDMRVRFLGHFEHPYQPELRRRILAVMAPTPTPTEEICLLETEVGKAMARAAAALVKKLGLRRVDLIGSHGQTICHLPPGSATVGDAARGNKSHGRRTAGTIQIGDPAVIAARLRVPVVARFRQADVAVGGQGAPLVPWTDYILFRHPRRSRIIQNIGGVANLTWLPAGSSPEGVIAFDSGPGNMVIDALVRRFTAGRERFDRDGRRAARGKPHAAVLNRLLRHPFLTKAPPKSCGREEFGDPWLQRVLVSNGRRRLDQNDWAATATAFTAATITRAYAKFLPRGRGGRPPFDEIVVCGGGARNSTLLRRLAEDVAREYDVEPQAIKIANIAEYGIPAKAKEVVSFAMLAAACVDGVSANLPQVTGARRRVVLGQVCNLEPRA